MVAKLQLALPTVVATGLCLLIAQAANAALIGYQAEDFSSTDGGNAAAAYGVFSDGDALGGEAVDMEFVYRLFYDVTIPEAGDYYLYLRGYTASDYQEDDVEVLIDGVNLRGTVVNGASGYAWSRERLYEGISAGTHTVRIAVYKSEDPILDAFAFGTASSYTDAELSAAVVPEPASLALLAAGLGCVIGCRRRHT